LTGPGRHRKVQVRPVNLYRVTEPPGEPAVPVGPGVGRARAVRPPRDWWEKLPGMEESMQSMRARTLERQSRGDGPPSGSIFEEPGVAAMMENIVRVALIDPWFQEGFERRGESDPAAPTPEQTPL
jgi:hypothetical protein